MASAIAWRYCAGVLAALAVGLFPYWLALWQYGDAAVLLPVLAYSVPTLLAAFFAASAFRSEKWRSLRIASCVMLYAAGVGSLIWAILWMVVLLNGEDFGKEPPTLALIFFPFILPWFALSALAVLLARHSWKLGD